MYCALCTICAIIPQKTLSKTEDRIINARETIEIDDNRHYDNVLLIDDMVGSGSAKLRALLDDRYLFDE